MPELLLLKALADETRLKLVGLLLNHNLCVRGLANRLKISEAAVSQHLQILRQANMVKGKKRGYWTYYSVERDVLRELADQLNRFADQIAGPMGCRILPERKECICKGCCEKAEKLMGEPEERTPDQMACRGDFKVQTREDDNKPR